MNQSQLSSRDILTLDSKRKIAGIVIEEALIRFSKPIVLWTGGKDSTVVLHLVRQICRSLEIGPPPVMFIDHGQHHKETWEFIQDVTQAWDLDLVIARNDSLLEVLDRESGMISLESLDPYNRSEALMTGISDSTFDCTLHTVAGNHLLKTVPMKRRVKEDGFDALYTGIRWDENPARSTEVFFSKRSGPRHVRVHPVLPFTEDDIWNHIRQEELPVNPLYARGFRSFDGIDDTTLRDSVPAWEQDTEKIPERAGRSQDKEDIMRRLRELGYM